MTSLCKHTELCISVRMPGQPQTLSVLARQGAHELGDRYMHVIL